MSEIGFSFLVSTLAGLSTLLGTIFLLFKKPNIKVLVGSLAFAAGVMFLVSVVDLIPSAYNSLRSYYLIIPTILFLATFFSGGFILSMLVDKYLPDNKLVVNSKLYKVGIITMLLVILHNIPEGIATFMATNNNSSLGIVLSLAIALHNIPEGISISMPIYYATGSKSKAFFYTLISALSEPFGALVSWAFLRPFLSEFYMGLLYAVIAGIMLHIVFYELLPTTKNYNQIMITVFSFVFGILVMLFSHLI
ncbi:MAG: ZIP family metal transporter [Bacilli bacterium]